MSKTGVKPFNTLPELFRYATDKYRCTKALNYPIDGEWFSMSSEAVLEMVRRFALGLKALGLEKGQTVGLLAQSSPWWLISDLAIQIAGGICVAIFPKISQKNFEWEVTNSSLEFLIVMGEEQWPVYKASEERLAKVITRDIQLAEAEQGKILTFDEVLKMGDELSDKNPGLYAELQEDLTEDHVATIIYTSGSTGCPKGVELTQKNLVYQVKGGMELFPIDPAVDKAFSVLPLAHVFERMVIYYYLGSGVPIYFADDVKNLRDLLRSSRPTIMTMVPRILEKLYSRLQSRIEQSSYLNRAIGRWAFALANSGDISGFRKVEHLLADRLVYSKLRNALGGNLHSVVSGGAALDAQLCRFFLNMGINVYQGYGQTESAPVISSNREGQNKPGTVGLPWPGMEVRISDEGEILARGPCIMRGYHKNPEATAQTVDEEGWLHTGDLGKIDQDGYLSVVGRLKEILKTSGGKMVAPVPIEQQVCQHPLIDMALVLAEGRKYVTCLLFPDFDILRQLKKQSEQKHLSHEAFLKSSEIVSSIEAHIAEVNSHFERWEQIQKYRFVCFPVSVEGGELTPTLKIRRSAVERKYADLIQEMYEEEAEVAPL